jgi:hypothetical protein
LILAVFASASGEHKKDLELQPQADKGMERVTGNEYVEIATGDSNLEHANFTMGTTGGHPNNPYDNSKTLVFSHPHSGSSFTTVRIDGNDYKYGYSDGVFTINPYVKGDLITCTWEVGNIAITQNISIVRSIASSYPDTAKLNYVIWNNDDIDHEVGVRIMLDIAIGDDDGAPIDIPGTAYVEYEREFDIYNMPLVWSAVSGTVNNPVFKAFGTLIGFGALTPDKFAVAYWDRIFDTLWDYYPSTDVSVADDSAVAIWWDPLTIPPGSYRTITTYYGLGQLPCPFTVASSDSTMLDDLRQFRDSVLDESESGRELIQIYYHNSAEVSQILMKNPDLAIRSAVVLRDMMPGIRFLIGDKRGRNLVMTPFMVNRIERLLHDIGKEGDEKLFQTLSVLTDRANSCKGMLFSQIRERIQDGSFGY